MYKLAIKLFAVCHPWHKNGLIPSETEMISLDILLDQQKEIEKNMSFFALQ